MKFMKGQSAVEYVTTYGWALFALVIVIAIILGTGIFTPDFFISEKCELGTNIPCKAAVYNSGGETRIALELINGFPYAVEVKSVDVALLDGSASFTGFPGRVSMQSGQNRTFQGTLSGTTLEDNAIKQLTIRAVYVSCALELGEDCSTNEHMLTGKIIAKVIPSD